MKADKLRFGCLFSILFIVTSSVFADNSWLVIYTDNIDYYHHDVATAMAIDAKGNIYITGYAYAQDTCADFMTVRLNKSGDVKWQQKYAGITNLSDYAAGIALDRSGDVYVTGTSHRSQFTSDIVTIKYTSNGKIAWTVNYQKPEYGYFLCQARAIFVDQKKNVYVTGTISTANTTHDYLTIKYNPAGFQEWVATYNGTGNGDDQTIGLVADNAGNTYVCGFSMGKNSNYDITTIKYDSKGNQEWVSRYDSRPNVLDADDIPAGLSIDTNANIYIAGYSKKDLTREWTILKIDRSGKINWVKNYRGNGGRDNIAKAIANDSAGNVYVTGYAYNLLSNYDYTTIKYNPSGQMLWLKTFNTVNNYQDLANSICLDFVGGVYITGTSYPGTNIFSSDTAYSITTVKYSVAGDSVWAVRYNPSRSAKSIDIKTDRKNNVYVLGHVKLADVGERYVLIKYVQRR
ncbi:MAG: SBBP repeat-containing protein [Candidatus Latescibacteria bacterium]|nr:SBBP repeat-containing protein [Candidatus Latescibacterota bacterium]